MLTQSNGNQEATDKSDFHEFLKVLEDLEDQGDHIAIDSSVTTKIKKRTNSLQHDKDNFFFDISGDHSNLKKGFLSNIQITYRKNETEKYIQQSNKHCATRNKSYNSLNISSNTETNSEDEQNVGKKKRKNKNIFIKYKYNDNSDNYLGLNNNLNGAARDMLILREKSLKKNDKKKSSNNNFRDKLDYKDSFPEKRLSKDVLTINSQKIQEIETCPSLCGFTDDDIKHNRLDFLEFSNNELLSDNGSTDQCIEDNYFKTPAKHKKFKRVSGNESFRSEFVNFIDIRDSDCEVATFSSTKNKLKNRVNNSNFVRTELLNSDIKKLKGKKRKFSPSNEDISSPIEEYVCKKRLKFVNVEDSDCEMYSKLKKKTKLNMRQPNGKQLKSPNSDTASDIFIPNVPLVSELSEPKTCLKTSNDVQNISNNNSIIDENLKNIESTNKNKCIKENLENISSDTKIKNELKSKTNIDSYNYDFWQNSETTKSIFEQNKNNNSNNIFLSIDQMNWDGSDNIAEDTLNMKKINIVDMRDSDCKISTLTKIKKKRKRKSKCRKDQNNRISNDKISQSDFKRDDVSDEEKTDMIKHDTSRDSNFTNKIIENIIKNESYYDFEFNNMEEIKKDFDTSGISFEEDLSIIQHTDSSYPKLIVKKQEDINKTEVEKMEIVSEISKLEENPQKNVKLQDLDVTRLSVLVDLKSVKENVKSSRKFLRRGNSKDKVIIEVSYLDSNKQAQNWSIGIRNVDENKNSVVSRPININKHKDIDSDLCDNAKSKHTEGDINDFREWNDNDLQDKTSLVSETEIKNEDINEVDNEHENYTNITSDLEINNESSSDEKMKTNQENNKCASTMLELGSCTNVIENGSSQEVDNHNEFDTDFNKNESTSLLMSEKLPNERLKVSRTAIDLQHQQVMEFPSSEYDTDDVFEDELKSVNIVDPTKKCLQNCSNVFNVKDKRNLQELVSVQEVQKNSNGNVPETIQEDENLAAGSVFEHSIVSNQTETSDKETASLDILQPIIPHISTSSTFDENNLSDEYTTLQNINLEDLKETLSEENSLESKSFNDPDRTENFLIVSQPGSDNENNLNSLLIFDDIDNITLNGSQQQDIKPYYQNGSQIIKDLENFIDQQNIEELFGNSERAEEIDIVNNNEDIVSTQKLRVDATATVEGNDPLEGEFEPDSKGKEKLIPQSEIKQSTSEDETEDLNVSDCSNYSDELNSPSFKKKYLGEIQLTTSFDTTRKNRKTNQIDIEYHLSENSDYDDGDEHEMSELFFKEIRESSDFSDESDSDVDIDVTSNQKRKLDDSLSNIEEPSDDGPYRSVTKDDIDDIRNLRINLSVTQSPLHQMVTRASIPTKQQHEAVRKYAINLRTGIFSREEDEIIKRNWENFLKEYKLDIPPTAMFKFPNKMKLEQRTLFIKYLSQGLDTRWPHSVHERFRNIYALKKWKMGRYTQKEDKIIIDYLAETESRHPYKDLEKMLNRPAYNILQRFRYYQEGNKEVTKWTLVKVENFIKNLMKISKCNDIEELRHKKFSPQEWRKLARRMKNNTPAHYVKSSWKLSIHHRLFSDDVPLPVVKAELLERLENANVTEWKQINWEKIATDFHGYNSTYLRLAFRQMSKYIPPTKRKNLRECLSTLRKKYPSQKIARAAEKKLKWENGRLKYRDGTSDNNE